MIGAFFSQKTFSDCSCFMISVLFNNYDLFSFIYYHTATT